MNKMSNTYPQSVCCSIFFTNHLSSFNAGVIQPMTWYFNVQNASNFSNYFFVILQKSNAISIVIIDEMYVKRKIAKKMFNVNTQSEAPNFIRTHLPRPISSVSIYVHFCTTRRGVCCPLTIIIITYEVWRPN